MATSSASRSTVAVADRRAFLEQRRPGVVEHHRLFERRAVGADPFDGLHVVALAEPLRQQQQAQPPDTHAVLHGFDRIGAQSATAIIKAIEYQ